MRFILIFLAMLSLIFSASCSREKKPATPLETFQTYAKAVKQKDTTTMKLLLSSESIRMQEQEAKARGVTLDDVVKGQTLIAEDQRTLEFRNEKIEGETASLEVKRGAGWETVPFVLEDSVWKLDTKGYADRFVEGIQQDAQKFEEQYNKDRIP